MSSEQDELRGNLLEYNEQLQQVCAQLRIWRNSKYAQRLACVRFVHARDDKCMCLGQVGASDMP